MTLEEALEVGKGKARSSWRSMTLEGLMSRSSGHTLGILLVKELSRGYTISATKQGEEQAWQKKRGSWL